MQNKYNRFLKIKKLKYKKEERKGRRKKKGTYPNLWDTVKAGLQV